MRIYRNLNPLNPFPSASPDLNQFIRMPGQDNLRVVNVALSINDDLNTIYPIMYKIFTLTDATNTLCFGPALMHGAFAGQVCEACIITIDECVSFFPCLVDSMFFSFLFFINIC